MKQHIVVKLRIPLAPAAAIPFWVAFIHDKSRAMESLTPGFDYLLKAAGLPFWVTREYNLKAQEPSPEERAHGLDRTYRVILQRDMDLPKDLILRIRYLPEVEEARPIAVVEAPVPEAALSLPASVLHTSAGEMIGLPFARLMSRGLPDVRVAVLDTGVDLRHPELEGRITQGADYVDLGGLDTTDFVGDFLGYDDVPEDEVGHGTHVSGIIAGRGLRIEEGVAPECGLLACRVLATMQDGDRRVGAGIVDNINTGIKWAVDQGADVINMSLGIRHTGGGLPHRDVIRYAQSRNVSVVAASGNDGTDEKYYPGALPNVWAVAAVDETGQPANFNSYGAPIACMAPGTRIFSAFARGGYAFASGTSQAAPFVSGAIALLKSYAREQGTSLTESDIGEILRRTSDRPNARLRGVHTGYGLINLADAFRMLRHQLT